MYTGVHTYGRQVGKRAYRWHDKACWWRSVEFYTTSLRSRLAWFARSLRLACGVEQLQLPSWAQMPMPGIPYAWITAGPCAVSSPSRTSRNGGSSRCGYCHRRRDQPIFPPTSSASSTRPLATERGSSLPPLLWVFRNLPIFYLKYVFCKGGAYPKEEQELVRALFFHVVGGAADELFHRCLDQTHRERET